MPKRIESSGFDWDSIKAEINSESWEDDWDNRWSQSRRVYLGTVFNLMPSGKYYQAFACSNVELCPDCEGTGSVKIHQSKRRQGKAAKRVREHYRHLCGRLRTGKLAMVRGLPRRIRRDNFQGRYFARMATWSFTLNHLAELAKGSRQCPRCLGLGSHEARLDEDYQEALEREAESVGLSVTSGEGDPCDIFAVEYRDKPEDEEDEWEEDETTQATNERKETNGD